MKQQKTIQTAAYYRRRKRQNVCCMLLRVMMIAAVVICVWYIDLSCALGWIRNARAGENWPADFVGYGQMMIIAVVLLTAAAVLVLFRRNWIALGVSAAGTVLCLIPLVRVASYAADSGFYSRLMDMPADRLYYMEILPTLLVPVCVTALALIQYFSISEKAGRMAKKQSEQQHAPSILDET